MESNSSEFFHAEMLGQTNFLNTSSIAHCPWCLVAIHRPARRAKVTSHKLLPWAWTACFELSYLDPILSSNDRYGDKYLNMENSFIRLYNIVKNIRVVIFT